MLSLGMTHIVNAKFVKGFGNLNFLLSIEEGIGELFTLTESALDDLEA